MTNENQRPVHLNLLKIRLPIAGIMSIMHRVSGLVLALVIPWLLYLMDISLAGEAGFAESKQLLQTPLMTIIVFLMIWALLHHFLAGIRYLLLDVDIGVEKPLYRQSAWVVVILAPVLALVLTGGLL